VLVLEPRVQAEFDEIRAIMRGETARSVEAGERAKQRLDDHAKRMAEMDAAHQQRMAEIDRKHQKQMAAIEKRAARTEEEAAKHKKRMDEWDRRTAERDRNWERRFAANEAAGANARISSTTSCRPRGSSWKPG
jgi:Skp family chaperone for outer membrane proteins